MKAFFVSLFIVLTTFEVRAAVAFVTWQSSPDGPRVILPRREGESAKDAVSNYLKALRRDSELAKLIPAGRALEPSGSISAVEELPKNTKTSVALVANLFDDMSREGKRVSMNVQSFTRAGGDVYVIALAADIRLTEAEAEEYRAKIARSVDLLVAMGGADIAPELYGEERTHAVNVNLRRDRSEFLLVQRFKREAKGIFFAVCRGHQMGAIVDGHKLFQDLSKDGVGRTEAHVNAAGATYTELQTWHHIYVNDSLLFRFLKKAVTIVNSVHHESVKLQPGAASVPVAEYEGIVEALQMKNKLGLSVQFHPDFTPEVIGHSEFAQDAMKILRGIVSYARLNRINRLGVKRCSALFAGGV